MSPGRLIVWIWGLAALSLVGSLSARKYDRPTLLVALLGALGAAARLADTRVVWLLPGTALPVLSGTVPLALSFSVLCAIVEKFAQREGHRAVLFATVAQLAALLVLVFAREFPAVSASPPPPLLFDSWVALACLAGYLLGANCCVVLYHMFRVLTGGRRLWVRGLLGPVVGGCVETFVTLPLGFGGRDPLGAFVLGRTAAWTLVAVATLPFLYAHRAVQGRRTNA